MDTRNLRQPPRPTRRDGTISLQLLVILVPVIFGFMGFAVDLGRLYLVRGEMAQAANAQALAAAAQLIGTSAATQNATAAAQFTLDNTLQNGNKYYFNSLLINDSTGSFQSTAAAPNFYVNAADALATDPASGQGGNADATTAQYAQAYITGDAPLLFWSILPLGQSRKTTVAASAIAGISAPLCTACAIQNFAIAAVDATDNVNFGLTPTTRYSLYFNCNGNPRPGLLGGTTANLPYLLIDRYDTGNGVFDETQQLFLIGANGLIPTAANSCLSVNATEVIWATATTAACTATTLNTSVHNLLCGLSTRMDSNTPDACSSVTDIANISGAYLPDTDATDITDYTSYAGNTRRIITVPVVAALDATATGMQVLGFRQFLLEATPNAALNANNPADANGRFEALYIGNPMPLKQGRFDGACGISSGPGKVVLFQ